MAVGDDMTEGFVSSLGLDSKEFGPDGSALSPEDVAWADSCLAKDADISETDWSSLTDALLETLSAQYDSPANEEDEIRKGAKMMEICSSDEDTRDAENLNERDNSNATSSEVTEPNSRDSLSPDTADDFWSKHNIEDVFLPTYNESSREIGNSDPELEFVFRAFQLDQASEDIFKVWDLNIPPEEDDLIKQLNKALTEGSPESTIPVSDDPNAWKGLKDESLDDLISGIADLSLSPNSG